jgi:acyl-homoserine-lactone acylase
MRGISKWGIALVLVMTGCVAELQPRTPGTPAFEATVWRTQYGVAHIVANDLSGLGFGQGYAFAQDHVCLLADQVLKVRAERAKFLGPGADGGIAGSDFAYQLLDLMSRARAAFPRQPAEVQAMMRGYVAGYNRYLADTGRANLPALCANADWVRPIDEIDLLAYLNGLAVTGGSFPFLPAMLNARRPGARAELLGPPASRTLDMLRQPVAASNGWAIGAERSATGRGMLLANPHFPWEGELRLWENHLVIPGKLNVYGASLLGLPGVQVGFNEDVAWTHTFTHGAQSTLYLLQLVPGNPMRYLYDGKERELEARELTIQVRQPDGTLADARHTFYLSHHGPIISLPGFEWGEATALAIRDPNLDNTAMVAQWLGMMRARSLAEFQQVFATVQGAAFVNTMAVDRAGTAWYVNSASTPNVSNEVTRQWEQTVRNPTPTPQRIFYHELGVPLWLFDGSSSTNEWVAEPGARSPGLIPFARAPQQTRRDFLFNANNPHWLANPAALLEGFSPQYGLEHEPVSPRARLNATMLTEVREGGASGADGKFTREELEAALFSNRGFTAELLRAQVVERCRGKATGTAGGKPVDITGACTALAGWDGRYNLDSVGAVVWRELMGTYVALNDIHEGGALFATPFSPTDPVGTPHTLKPAPATGSDPLLDRLAQAVVKLGEAGIAVDAPLGKAQFFPRAGRNVPIHGGGERDAVLNLVTYESLNSSLQPPTPQGPVVNPATALAKSGYVVNTGSTFMMTLAFTERGVDAAALLMYSESEDPRSPHYDDQMDLFVNRKLRKVVFSMDDVAREAGVEKRELR